MNVRLCPTSALMASASIPWAHSGASARLATPQTSAEPPVWVRQGISASGGCQLPFSTSQLLPVEHLYYGAMEYTFYLNDAIPLNNVVLNIIVVVQCLVP